MRNGNEGAAQAAAELDELARHDGGAELSVGGEVVATFGDQGDGAEAVDEIPDDEVIGELEEPIIGGDSMIEDLMSLAIDELK